MRRSYSVDVGHYSVNAKELLRKCEEVTSLMRRSYSVHAEELLRRCGEVTLLMRRSYSVDAEELIREE